MKTRLVIVTSGLVFFCITGGVAQAALFVDGTVSYKGEDVQLIYDSDLDITWLDYRNEDRFWDNQMNWATELGLEVNGIIYDNWRLPGTVDGPFEYGWDSTTTGGYNITTSELGHLFYVDLNNKGSLDIYGNSVGIGNDGLKNTGVFNSLINGRYWSGTENSSHPFDVVWVFDFGEGAQDVTGKVSLNYSYGIAVHDGRIAAIPIPATVWLLGSGLIGLVGIRYRKKH